MEKDKFTKLTSLVDRLAQSNEELLEALSRQSTGHTGLRLVELKGDLKQIRAEIAAVQAG